MKKLFKLLSFIIIPALMVSCETDFNVISKYKEVAIVYGLLNQKDTIHYLRINKAFLGDGDAITYSQIADSSSFGANIKVMLIESTPGGTRREIVFDTVTLFNKEPGDFYSPGQLFYYSKAILNQENTYELNIKSKNSDYEVTSVTTLIHDFYFKTPSTGATSISFRRSISSQKKFEWYKAINGKRYQFSMYFNYKELGLNGDTTFRKIEWTFPEQIWESTGSETPLEEIYQNEDFFKLCESKIPYSDPIKEEAVVKRFASTCDLEVNVVGDEFNTYLASNGSTSGILTEKPSYTNIINGLGLFSSRYQIRRLPILLDSPTILDLSTTTNLKFAKPN